MTRPLDLRREVLPPLLALLLSVAAHSALFGLNPLDWTREEAPDVETVTVEFLSPPGTAAPSPSGTVAPREPQPAPLASPPEPASKPAARANPAVPDESPPAPAPQTIAEPTPRQPPHPEQVAEPRVPFPQAAPPPQAVQPPETEQPGEEPGPPSLALEDLLPNRSDLEPFAGNAELPDPTAAGVREATLSLGHTDHRYRSYLDSVHAAIDASEKWKEAVLMGGGGVVVVRMTLNSLGQLESAAIERSSGRHLLDNAALEAIQRAKIPPFPSHWQIERLHLDAQFNYQLVTY